MVKTGIERNKGGTSARTVAVVELLTLVLGVAHHVEHVVRGDAGWPVTGPVNAFTYSLLIYPIVAVGQIRAARGHDVRRYWTVVAAAGFALVAVTHLGPLAADPARRVYSAYESPLTGALALGLLVGLLASLAALFVVARRSGSPHSIDHPHSPGSIAV